MNKIHEWINTILIVGVLLVALVGGQSTSFGGANCNGGNCTDYDAVNVSEGYYVDDTEIIDGSGSLQVGTALDGIRVGSCTIWAPDQTIAATSTQQAVCQSATNGSLTSSLTGVTTDAICNVTNASSTNTTIGGIVVGGVSASSTAGNIVVRLVNLTGTTFTWDATASSSAKWQYTCFDPE